MVCYVKVCYVTGVLCEGCVMRRVCYVKGVGCYVKGVLCEGCGVLCEGCVM